MSQSSEMPCLRIIRRFDVPPERVFDAVTKPDAMRVWWGEAAAWARQADKTLRQTPAAILVSESSLSLSAAAAAELSR